MPGVLDFDHDRDLGFNPNRDLGFDSNRELGFDSGRDLAFDADRDLGFGKRGVVFRGYICPICASSVTEDQATCGECGAIFDSDRIPEGKIRRTPSPPAQAPPKPTTRAPPPPPRKFPPPPKRADTEHCIFCGARLLPSDGFCWNCGNRVPPAQGR